IEVSGTKQGIAPTVVFVNQARKDNGNNWYEMILSQKPKIIVFGGLPPKDEVQLARLAQQEGIKVADVNFGNAPTSEAKAANVDIVFSLLADHESVGKRAAEFVASSKKRANPKVLIIGGPADDSCSIARTNGFKDTLKNLVPQAQIV